MKVYIAGALSSKENDTRNPSMIVTDYIQNLSRMCQVAVMLRNVGYYPYVPGLDFLLGFRAGDWQERDYRDIGMAFLAVCDAVFVISYSWGVKKEIEWAEQNGIPVFYSFDELEKYRRDNKGGKKQ